MLCRSLCDHPLPLHAAVTRDSRSEFLDGHLQSEEDGGFVLVEHGDDAPTVDDGNLPVECVGHIAGFAVDCPDAGRSDLVGKNRRKTAIPSKSLRTNRMRAVPVFVPANHTLESQHRCVTNSRSL